MPISWKKYQCGPFGSDESNLNNKGDHTKPLPQTEKKPQTYQSIMFAFLALWQFAEVLQVQPGHLSLVNLNVGF